MPQCRVGSSRGSDKCSILLSSSDGQACVPECESRFHVLLGPSHMELHISPSFLGSVSYAQCPHDYLVCEILSSMCKLKNCDLRHTHTKCNFAKVQLFKSLCPETAERIQPRAW